MLVFNKNYSINIQNLFNVEEIHRNNLFIDDLDRFICYR